MKIKTEKEIIEELIKEGTERVITAKILERYWLSKKLSNEHVQLAEQNMARNQSIIKVEEDIIKFLKSYK